MQSVPSKSILMSSPRRCGNQARLLGGILAFERFSPGNRQRLALAVALAIVGTVKLAESRLGREWGGWVDGRDDDASRPDLRRPSLPRCDHQLGDMAVFPVPVEPALGDFAANPIDPVEVFLRFPEAIV